LSATRLQVVTNVRSLIDDENPSRYAISSSRINRIVDMETQRAAQVVGLGPTWSAGAVTLVAGTSDYTLSGYLLDRILEVRMSYQNRILGKLTPLEMASIKQGPTESQGYPRYYSVYETAGSGSYIMTVDPVPTAAEIGSGLTLDLFVTETASTLASDSGVIYFSDQLLRDLEKSIAAHCVVTMTDDELAERKLSRESAALWSSQADDGYRMERHRLIRPRIVSHIARGAF
jgi:hypothetical protein